MTQWVQPDGSGRGRGPVGIVRAWVTILVAPRRFFGSAVAPGDQAPGLIFLAGVVGIEEASRYVLVPGAAPVLDGRPLATATLALLATVVLVAPAGLHLLAAVQTVLLWPVAADRAGVSETVQVLAYATAPCVFTGVPVPLLTLVCTGYGATVLVIGLSTVHDLAYHRAAIAGFVPAVLLFGVAFGGFDAAGALL